MNPWWLLLIVPGTILVGALVTLICVEFWLMSRNWPL